MKRMSQRQAVQLGDGNIAHVGYLYFGTQLAEFRGQIQFLFY